MASVLSIVSAGEVSVAKPDWQYVDGTVSNVIISEYHITGDDGALLPADNFSLSFKKIEMKYAAEKYDGTPAGNYNAGWDLSEDR